MKRALSATLALIAFAVIAGAAAAAENGLAYNGSYCKAYYGTQTGDFNNQYNGIYNLGSAGRYISCPVVVDEVAVVTGTTRVWLYWRANVSTDTISCTLFSMNGDGSVRQSQSANKAGTGWFSIPNLTTDDFWGSYSMYCYLPRFGTLNTVWVGEQS
jgi:hypothetical protein